MAVGRGFCHDAKIFDAKPLVESGRDVEEEDERGCKGH